MTLACSGGESAPECLIFEKMSTVPIKLYDLLRKDLNPSDERAALFVDAFQEAVQEHVPNEKEKLATKDDLKVELKNVRDDIHKLEISMCKTVLVAGFLQLLGVIGGVIAIVKFMVD